MNIQSFIIILILVWLLNVGLSILFDNKAFSDWWNQTGGSEYKDQLNMFELASVNHASGYIWYYLSKLVGSNPLNDLNIDQYRFIIKRLAIYYRWNLSDNTQTGIITPKMLCDTITIQKGDGDVAFDSYATLRDCWKDDGLWDADNCEYIWPKNGEGWKNRILYWLNGRKDTGGSGPWVYTTTSSGQCSNSFQLTGEDPNTWNEGWDRNDGDKQPYGDNILARMGINFNSPMILSYIDNKANCAGYELDPNAFQNLIGDNGKGGGWIQFLVNNSGKNTDQYINSIDASLSTGALPNQSQKECKPNGMAVASSVLGALSPLMFIPGLGEGASLVKVVATALTVGTAVVSGINTAQQC